MYWVDRNDRIQDPSMAVLQSPVFPLSGSIDSSDEVNITRNKPNVKI